MRVWGLDIGTTSVGFAVVTHDPDAATGTIERMGVRIFPEGVTEKDREPRNKQRRQARLMRRQIRRRRWRRKELGRLLAEAGLLPPYGSAEWNDLVKLDPYDLRARGLRERLEPHAIGRALYHVVKRRGFQSARVIEDDDKKKEEGVVKEQIEGLRAKLNGETLGKWLAAQPRKRGSYVGRDMVREEFSRLWNAQAAHHPKLLSDSLRETIEDVAFAQRPIYWRVRTLGECLLEPGKPLLQRGSWLGQQFVLLQKLNSLRLAGGNARPLDDEERGAVLSILKSQAKMTWPGVRKALKPIWERHGISREQKFNLEVGGDKHLPGNIVEHELAKAFGEAWPAHREADRIRSELGQRLWEISYQQVGRQRVEIRNKSERDSERDKFVAAVQSDWRVDEATARRMADIDLPSGWLRHSEHAVRRLLPHLEAGALYSDAKQTEYPQSFVSPDTRSERLPSRTATSVEGIRNPTVARALNEVRKVVNNLLAAHGRPDVIRIELARDLRLPKAERAKAEKANRDRERERDKARAELANNGIGDPSRDDVDKWLLWQECKETCPYTGQKISFDALFRTGEFQIEHIFPLSRSLDNGFANKTLCHVDVNRVKTNRTAFEYLSSLGAEALAAANVRLANSGLPEGKIRRFFKEAVENAASDELAERQLRDTSYIARAAKDFIAQLGVPVESCNGRVTAQLRHFWGLDHLLGDTGEKNRADHRHHAVDALAIALTSRAFVKRLSDAYAHRTTVDASRFRLPWDTLRADVQRALEHIVVSHRVRRKVSGALHKQTAMGDTGQDMTEGKTTYGRFVTRVPLERITKSQIEDIRDDDGGRIRRLVQEHVLARGGDPKKAFPPYPVIRGKDGSEREVRKVRVWVKQQRQLVVPLSGRNRSVADLADNHHMAVYRRSDGKVEFETVSLFEATKRKATKKPVVAVSSGRELIMSLSPGDTIEFPNGANPPSYRVVQSVWANGQIVLADHLDATGGVWKRPNAGTLLAARAQKVSVDPIGRVRPAND